MCARSSVVLWMLFVIRRPVIFYEGNAISLVKCVLPEFAICCLEFGCRERGCNKHQSINKDISQTYLEAWPPHKQMGAHHDIMIQSLSSQT